MTYTERQVARGRKLVANLGKCKWDLGDLALEITPDMGDGRSLEYRTSPELSELQEFAEEIELSWDSLRSYRRVAAAFPKDKRRMELSYAVHSEFAPRDDRFKLLKRRQKWTKRTAREYLGRPMKEGPAAPALPGVSAGQGGFSPPPTGRQIAAALASDPNLAGEVLADPVGHSAANNLRNAQVASFKREQSGRPAPEPDATGTWLNVSKHILASVHSIREAAIELKDVRLNKERQDDLLEQLGFLEGATGVLREAIETGDRSFDDKLAAFMEGI